MLGESAVGLGFAVSGRAGGVVGETEGLAAFGFPICGLAMFEPLFF